MPGLAGRADTAEAALERLGTGRVKAALWTLPEPQRIALTLMDLCAFTAAQVAAIPAPRAGPSWPGCTASGDVACRRRAPSAAERGLVGSTRACAADQTLRASRGACSCGTSLASPEIQGDVTGRLAPGALVPGLRRVVACQVAAHAHPRPPAEPE